MLCFKLGSKFLSRMLIKLLYEAHFLQGFFPEILFSITNHSELIT